MAKTGNTSRRVKIVVNVEEGLRREVKSKAALTGMTVSDAVRLLLRAWTEGKVELPEEEDRT